VNRKGGKSGRGVGGRKGGNEWLNEKGRGGGEGRGRK